MGQIRFERGHHENPCYPAGMPARLHHLALGARDVDTLATFYEDILDLPRLQTHRFDDGGTRSVWLSLGNGSVLMIETVDEQRIPATSRPPGLFLLALSGSEDERASLQERLEGMADGSRPDMGGGTRAGIRAGERAPMASDGARRDDGLRRRIRFLLEHQVDGDVERPRGRRRPGQAPRREG